MKFEIKDPGSAITHFIGMLMAAFAATPLLIRAASNPDKIHLISLSIFIISMILLYAIAGIILKLFWITCPKWFSSVLYIAMGWVCVLAFTQILNSLSPAAFGWLLAGGIIYTVGGIIYALKLPLFNARHKYFGSHEIFHLFVMGGSICHFIMMYVFVAKMPIGL